VFSEPLDEDETGWIEISPGTAIATDGRTLEKLDFRPETCVRTHKNSAGFA
jgi:glutamine amidotransferase